MKQRGAIKYVGPPYRRAKIYAARMPCGGSSHRSIFGARARAQQQTRRPALLLSIDGTDGQTDGRTLDRYTRLNSQTSTCRTLLTQFIHNRAFQLRLEKPGVRFTKYLTIILRYCQSYDRLTTDVGFATHLSKNAGFFLGTIPLQNHEIV